ncbi:MAG: RNA polymerase sigma factor [Acidimicrobiia bacterium]
MTEDFATFYRDTKDVVFRAVAASTRSVQDAEEATAEGYARAYSKWSSVATHPNPGGWVVVSALNYHRSTWRKIRRLVPLKGSDDGWVAPAEPPDPIAEQVMELPLRQREAIALCVIMGMDSVAAGEALGVSSSTVRVHLHRGLSKLRAISEKENLKL